jgi:hypothetical protein
MSLGDTLELLAKESKNQRCKLGVLMDSGSLELHDHATLITILQQPKDDPARVTNKAIAALLRDEGYDITDTTVDRHRSKTCLCHKVTRKARV